jgi:hypothetical protein
MKPTLIDRFFCFYKGGDGFKQFEVAIIRDDKIN